jgi:hypothetical protein
VTLEQASLAALAAAEAGDLEALELALEARAAALAAGEAPTPGTLSAGELTLQHLREFRAKLHRLQQFTEETPAAAVDVRA